MTGSYHYSGNETNCKRSLLTFGDFFDLDPSSNPISYLDLHQNEERYRFKSVWVSMLVCFD